MTRQSILPQTRRHIFVYDEDWEFIEVLCQGAKDSPGVMIKKFLHKRVMEMRERTNAALSAAADAAKETK